MGPGTLPCPSLPLQPKEAPGPGAQEPVLLRFLGSDRPPWVLGEEGRGGGVGRGGQRVWLRAEWAPHSATLPAPLNSVRTRMFVSWPRERGSETGMGGCPQSSRTWWHVWPITWPGGLGSEEGRTRAKRV